MADIKLTAWRTMLEAHSAAIDILSRELAEEHDLPLAWYEVLLYLSEADEGHLRMHELAESLLLSRSAATRFIDRMEEAGLVTRQACPTDRRGMFVVLTAQGRRRFVEAAPTHLAGITRTFSDHVTDEEARIMVDVLGRVKSALCDGVTAGV